MAEMKKGGLYEGASSEEEEFQYDPEAEDNTRKFRLPFALCKANGITIQDWWTPRDAWEALKKGGYVDDVSEEYKEYYSQLKKERNKKHRQRAKNKNAQLKDPRHNPTKGYVHQDGAIDGAVRSNPMTFEQADSGNVNPYFGKGIGYNHNCQTCVATYVARRQGYDVRALPNLNNKNIYRLSYDTSLAYIDDNGQHPKQVKKPNGARIDSFLEQAIKPNDIYSVEFVYRGAHSGHIITAERGADGAIRLYDPQSNKTVEKKDFAMYFRNTNAITLMNLTNCRIDETFADTIMKKSKQ